MINKFLNSNDFHSYRNKIRVLTNQAGVVIPKLTNLSVLWMIWDPEVIENKQIHDLLSIAPKSTAVKFYHYKLHDEEFPYSQTIHVFAMVYSKKKITFPGFTTPSRANENSFALVVDCRRSARKRAEKTLQGLNMSPELPLNHNMMQHIKQLMYDAINRKRSKFWIYGNIDLGKTTMLNIFSHMYNALRMSPTGPSQFGVSEAIQLVLIDEMSPTRCLPATELQLLCNNDFHSAFVRERLR